MSRNRDLRDLRLKAEQLFPGNTEDAYLSYKGRLEKGEPIAYILENIEFFGNTIHLNRDVLIPRMESEILLEMACKEIKHRSFENKALLDLCCGSGALGLGAKRECPELLVTLSDISSDAIKVATKNSEVNNLDVQIIQGDFLEKIEDQSVDFLLFNPPYISKKEYESLECAVQYFEPKQALLAPEKGLFFYRKAQEELPRVLKSGAQLFFEIGYQQGAALIKIFSSTFWKNTRVLKDWSGLDRFFFLEIQ